jgi:uncharacterized protein YgiM (DUF1202 family)
MIRIQLRFVFVAVLGWYPLGPVAETAYIVDELLVGVHQTKDLGSAIMKVLPSGTRLEVLKYEGAFAQIEDEEQARGWVDAAYLTTEPPSTIRVAELRHEKAVLESRLRALAQQATTSPASGDNAAILQEAEVQIETLTKENTDLKSTLADERLRAEKLQVAVSALRAESKQTKTPAEIRISDLQRDREELQDSLDKALKTVAKMKVRSSNQDTPALLPILFETHATAFLASLAAIIIFAFAMGVYFMDLSVRKRHGGFRV